MEYTVFELAKMMGVSGRTLRYYDQIGLLKPERISSSGYRIYGEREVKVLRRIIFYKRLGMKLDDIKRILTENGFDKEKMLEEHLREMKSERERIEGIINSIEKIVKSKKITKNISSQKTDDEMEDVLCK